MFKSSSLDNRYFHLSIKNSVKSKWFALLILFPLAAYAAFHMLEAEAVSFVFHLFPSEPYKSTGFYDDLLNLVFSELLWITGFLFLTWIFVVYVPLLKVINQAERYAMTHSGVYVFVVISASFVLSVFISDRALERFANSSDEYAYLYQAQTMGNGKLWEFAHDLPEFFHFNHIAQKDGISVSRFPPGWPLILSTAYYFGFPANLVNPALGLITLIVFYSFARRFYGQQVALWSLTALALSSFYIFNNASYFSHTSCALFTVGFVYGVYRYLQRPRAVYTLLAGFCLGMVAITRYYTAVIIFLPFFFYLLYHCRWKSVVVFTWMCLGALPCMIFLFWYNNAITGNPLMPVTMWAYADEALGFVRGHTVAKGFEHIVRWSLMFFYWCSPGIFILYLVFLWRKAINPEERFVHPEDYIFVLLMIGYFFYYQIGGNQYGPRFFFEAFPFLIVFVVSKVFQYREKWALAVLALSVVYAPVRLPFIAQREHEVVDERNDLYNTVKESRITNAVVLVSSYTSVMRPMPIGDLTRNDIHYANDVLFAQDLKEEDSLLMDYYPDRAFYKYLREDNEVHGKLVKVER